MSERRPSNSGRPNRGSDPRRSGGPRPGGFSRGPRRDDDRPSGGGGRFNRDDRAPRGDRNDRPRRDRDDRAPRGDRDDRPSRGRFDRDSRPSGGGGRFNRDDRAPRGDRDDRPARRFDRDDRAPRGDRDDRPARRFDRDDRPTSRFGRDDRFTKGPRRNDDRPSRFDRDDRPARRFDRDDRAPRGDRDDRPARRFDRDDRAPRGDRDDRPARRFDRDDRPARRFDRDDRPSRGRFDRDDRGPRAPRTAAQERSEEVKWRTGGRRTSGEMSTPPERSREEWIDEGSTRPIRRPEGIRAKGTGRSQKGGRKEVRALDSVVEEFEKKIGSRGSARAIKRYEAALQAFEAHRYEDARKILNPMAKEYSDVSAVHEMLGLCLYRAGQWKRALVELETAIGINPDWIFNHAVLEDCHRALGNHQMVEKYWRELAEASPHPEILAEGRIVMAGSMADRGHITEALALMGKAANDQSRPAEYHLRQWFVIADLYDKEGNVIKARQFFERIASHDPQFIDVAERLATLGA
jgi:Tfp pilus assembly protein PilF